MSLLAFTVVETRLKFVLKFYWNPCLVVLCIVVEVTFCNFKKLTILSISSPLNSWILINFSQVPFNFGAGRCQKNCRSLLRLLNWAWQECNTTYWPYSSEILIPLSSAFDLYLPCDVPGWSSCGWIRSAY